MTEENLNGERNTSTVLEDYGYQQPVCPNCNVYCNDMGVMCDEEDNAREWECPVCMENVWKDE